MSNSGDHIENSTTMFIPEFYVRNIGDIICVPQRGEDNSEFKCKLINLRLLDGVINNQEVIISVVMNGKVVSHTVAKNGSIVRYSSPIYRTINSDASTPTITIFEQTQGVRANEVRTSVHVDLNQPDCYVKVLEDESPSTETEIWDFLSSQQGDHNVFVPHGVTLRIPVREILKIYSSAMPVSIAMSKTFYYYCRITPLTTVITKRYVTLPTYTYTRSSLPLTASARLTDTQYRFPWNYSAATSLATPMLAENSSDSSSSPLNSNTQALIIGAAVIFFIALLLGFTLLYWFYTVESS